MQPVLWCVMCGVCDVGCAVVVGVLSVLWGVLWGVFFLLCSASECDVVGCRVWGLLGGVWRTSQEQLPPAT